MFLYSLFFSGLVLAAVAPPAPATDGMKEGSLGKLKGNFGSDKDFDYVVVGGGTGGNAIGARLAEAGFRVAIVEAGTYMEISKPILSTTPGGDIIGVGWNTLDTVPTIDWAFQTEPQAGANNRKFHYAQGKCVGGSSALNFMIYHRGTTGTYDQWAEAVGDDSYR
jgi:choline dehydrogenase